MKIQLNETILELMGYGVDNIGLWAEIKYPDTFDSLEELLQGGANPIYILDSDHNKLESLYDYIKLDFIKKNLNEEITYSIALKKMTEYEQLKKESTDLKMALTEVYEMIGG